MIYFMIVKVYNLIDKEIFKQWIRIRVNQKIVILELEMVFIREILMEQQEFIKVEIEVKDFLISGENSRNNYYRGIK